ncbi:MAG: FAD-dependent oxidoreductase [Bradymonadales bacterium]|jgi:NADPH-dependent 2,4-dienoyl-CoA reductase/sulfur reductase-like enzyme/rhodanese-related sulfurtransferase
MKVVIVGGVAGGATAAARLRRLDESAEIVMIEKTGFVSYANCGLPYYLGKVIEKESALSLQSPDSFWQRFHVKARVNSEVLSIDRAAKSVRVRGADGAEYDESYDKLILSPGARAIKPRLPGVEHPRIMQLKTVEDCLSIAKQLESGAVRKAVVVGGGFIGLEAAENLIFRGIDTSIVELGDQVMPALDYDMASAVHAYLRYMNVKLLLGRGVTGFREEGEELMVQISDDSELAADLVVLAIGVSPDTAIARDAGLKLGNRNAIVVDEHMLSSDPDIYAVGDAIEVRHFVSDERSLIPLAGPANKQGRIAADNIAGIKSVYRGSLGTSILKIFDMSVASTGLSERAAKQAKIEYDKVVTFSASHATYYPGATNMTIKTLFDPLSGRILGAQITGADGVDKRIDVLATAIRSGLSSNDLEELELAYAPPYSSAKDPVNMVGFVIENVRHERVKQWHWHDLGKLPANAVLLDVRTDKEYERGHFKGSVHIPLDSLRVKLNTLDKTRPHYVNCHSALRSYIACRILSQNGFDCYNLSGGFRFCDQIAECADFIEK